MPDFLDPRNVIADGPDVFSQLIAIGIDPSASGAEGSPIYQTIDAEVTVSGSYTDGSIDYAFSGTTAITQRTRVAARDAIIGADISGENYELTRADGISSWCDFGVITGIDTLNFTAEQNQTLGANGGSPPFAPPGFNLGSSLEDFIEGTRTDTAPDPDETVARFIKLTVIAPYFTGSINDGTLRMNVRLDATVNDGESDEYSESFPVEIDPTSWDSADFRDIRGTYGETSYDANGIEYVWSVTVA